MQSPATQRAPAPAPEQGAPVLDSDGRPIRARPTQPLDAASTSGAVQAMDTAPVPPQVLIDAGAFAALACEVHRRVDAVERRLDRTLRDDGAGGRPSVFQQARRRITRGASISALWLGSLRAASISVWMFETG